MADGGAPSADPDAPPRQRVILLNHDRWRCPTLPWRHCSAWLPANTEAGHMETYTRQQLHDLFGPGRCGMLRRRLDYLTTDCANIA